MIMADKTIRTIGVLTSGGDAPGMNAGNPCSSKNSWVKA